MGQIKGNTGNPNGRPTGTPNKVTSTVRNWIVELISNNREQLETDLKNIEPMERLKMIVALLPYILPKVCSPDEVENAAYTKNDVIEKSFIEWGSNRAVKKWIE